MPDAASQLPDYTARIRVLREALQRLGLTALIVPRFDAHQGEYIAPCDERLLYVTGFSGSAGMAVVTLDRVALFVDGRYTVQAAAEVPRGTEHHHFHHAPPDIWAGKQLSGHAIGYDAMLLPPAWAGRFEAAAKQAGAKLVPLRENPIDAIWTDRPARPAGEITAFPLQFAGQSSGDKRDALLAWMRRQEVALCVETQPDNIAWFLNVRGDDVAYNPMPQSFLLADAAGEITWFVDQENFEPGLASALPSWLRICPRDSFTETLSKLRLTGVKVVADPDFSPAAVSDIIRQAGGEVLYKPSFLTLSKAVKNPTELAGIRACHIEDGVAWSEFSAWASFAVPEAARTGTPLTERDLELKIHALRRARPGFLSDSFRPISAAGGNAAMCHYATGDTRNAPVAAPGTYLLDSGGQYETGTTDATRSFCFGPASPEYKRAYTAVFKAFVALATLRFPPGTQGHHIDAICRRPLWDLGLDYDHGTGHGIGHRLSVHEQPQRIGKPYSPVDLRPGMVMSIEPGFYLAGQFGIRIENLFEITPDPGADQFMRFSNLTWAPISTAMLDIPALTKDERDWLNNYHSTLLQVLSPWLSSDAKTWARAALKPI